MSSSQYYPEKKLDSISAQNQPYPSPNYYPYPEPKNTFRLNPLVISSLKNIDIDDLQMAFGKGIKEKHDFQKGQKISNTKLFNENDEIKRIKDSIEQAKLNQYRAHQIQQNQVKRVQNLIKDTEADEIVLRKLEEERRKAMEEEERKKQERIKAKYLIQQQMKDKEFLKEEAKKEYEKDKIDVDNLINKLRQEDITAMQEAERKKNIQKIYMENSYAEKKVQKLKEKEADLLQKERERKYQEDIAKREEEINKKKEAIKFEKDKIFERLCQQEAKRQAERDYWENVRNELYVEQSNYKQKMKELEEKEKKQKQKEELLASAIEQMKYKEQRKKDEYNKINLPKKAEDIKTLTGEINISINYDKEQYAEKIKKTSESNELLMKKIIKEYKYLNVQLQNVITKINKINDMWKEFYKTSNKNFEGEVIPGIYNSFTNFMDDWVKLYKAQMNLININIREYYRYIRNEYHSIREYYTVYDIAKNNFKKMDHKLTETKERLFEEKKIDDWGLDKEDLENKILLFRDKELSMEKMLPEETKKVKDKKMMYGSLLNSLIDEYDHIQNLNSKRHKENSISFIKDMSNAIIEFHVSLNGIIGYIDTLKDDLFINGNNQI